MSFNREAHAASARKAVHYLGELVGLVDVEEGAVVAGDVVKSHGFACGHERPHRGHHLKVEDRIADEILVPPVHLGRRVEHEVAIAVDTFGPCLAPMFGIEIASVARQVNELLIRSGKNLHGAP